MTTTDTSTAPAKKPAAKKKAPAKKAAPPVRAKYSDDAKVKVLVDKNPRREGTDAHAKFACIKDGDTVGSIVKRAQAKGFNVRGLLIASVKREQISIK
jgi:hypothetical protein